MERLKSTDHVYNQFLSITSISKTQGAKENPLPQLWKLEIADVNTDVQNLWRHVMYQSQSSTGMSIHILCVVQLNVHTMNVCCYLQLLFFIVTWHELLELKNTYWYAFLHILHLKNSHEMKDETFLFQ